MQSAIPNAHRSAKSQNRTPDTETQKVPVVVAMRPPALVTVRVIVARSNSLMVNEVVGDVVLRSGLEHTKQRAQRTYVLPYNIARICARIGDNEEAFEWLEKAYKEHSDHLVLLKVDPIFDGIRSDTRYTSLLRRVGFDQ